jgi:hypothetical protein
MVLSQSGGGQTFTYENDKVVTALLPLQKDANQSISRLFRSPAGQLGGPVHIAADTYQDIFILAQTDKYEGTLKTFMT